MLYFLTLASKTLLPAIWHIAVLSKVGELYNAAIFRTENRYVASPLFIRTTSIDHNNNRMPVANYKHQEMVVSTSQINNSKHLAVLVCLDRVPYLQTGNR